ncbi:hypothetical protein A3H40_02620 [Candidatus Daviesbacteria bacterium RIFCSPLOWO2_02_FULL_38_15]|uniref:Response regulatory domain-containing protein n=1 Tax=Candidatus Daviesbacteria bacterium RIFCSPLOWO2_02_FULL_38_15 TaxID=1797794 RepID=A0A1F5N5A1_9BACT|nr:MAG: hypothetical protein A3H40_02620 [Candidatus Daviesbacteria bacterium RIFCSPLOWO2_02_FULL_38_15]
MSNNKTILFIEDEEDIISMYEHKFRSGGFNFLSALKGGTGFTMAKKQRPAIILLDMKLPDMDGLEVLTKLKEEKETKDIPVILFSNAYQKEYESKGKELGAEQFILKTKVMPAEMLNIIQNRLSVTQN